VSRINKSARAAYFHGFREGLSDMSRFGDLPELHRA
jgi:hypothetical protein